MNYIKQINAFWEIERERGDFTAHLQSFFFALLYFANKFDKAEFSLYRDDVIEQAKLSKDTYYRVRQQALEAGLIEFEEGANKRSKCLFRVCLLYEKKDNGRTPPRTTVGHGADTAPDHTQQTYKPTNLTNLQTYKQQREGAPSEDVADPALPGEENDLLEQQKKEEKEKASAQKEKEEEVSGRARERLYQDAWWEFYKSQNNGEEPPHSWRNHYTIGAHLKKIQQDLAAVFDNDEESGYQEFVSILQSWPKLRDYHRLQLQPKQIHKNLVEIRKYLRDSGGNVATVPYVNQAVSLYKDLFHELKGFPPNINGKGQQHVEGTLTYLKTFQEGNTWENAYNLFELILRAWPEIEKQDKFYSDNFTLSYIHGNTSKIIGIIKSKGEKTAELTEERAAAWLAANGFS